MEHPEVTTINKHFRPKVWGSNVDEDTEFSFRAYIHHTATSPAGEIVAWITMFPPTQYKTVEDKASFNRAMNEYLTQLNWSKVEVAQGGKAAFSFNKTA